MNNEIKQLTEGNIKDTILEYALSKPEKFLSAYEIQKDLIPELSLDEVKFLFEKIQSTSDKVADVRISENNCLIKSTGITKRFIEQGGFTKLQNEYLEEEKHQSEKERIDFEKSKIDLELAQRMLEEFPKTKWFARVGFIIGILLMLKELYILIWK
jgi:hypothetical protein